MKQTWTLSGPAGSPRTQRWTNLRSLRGVTNNTLGVFDALQYAVENYRSSGAVLPVISVSYSDCEEV